MRLPLTRMQWLTLFFFLFLGTLLFCVNTGRNAFIISIVRKIPGRDKTGHFLLMGFLSFMINASRRAPLTNWKPWKISSGTFFVLLFVTLEEGSQYFIPYRTCSFDDLTCNYLGVFCFGQWACWLQSRKKIQKQLNQIEP